MHTATFTKLRTGGWGLKIKAGNSTNSIRTSDVVSVSKRDGSVQTMNVGRILWSAPGVAIATIARQAAASFAPAPEAKAVPTLNVPGLFTFLQGAIDRGLKQPKLRMLASDGKSELRVSFAKRVPGALAVVVADTFLGYVKPDGTIGGFRLQQAISEQQRLLAVSVDPRAEAKRYAVLTSRCSFCNLPLTDEGSIEAGYGPVCAEHWGLPHTCKGTPQPVAPEAVAS